MTRPSPRPWRLVASDNRLYITAGSMVSPEGRTYVATVEPETAHPRRKYDAPCTCAQDNGILLAAAPELRDELRRVLDDLSRATLLLEEASISGSSNVWALESMKAARTLLAGLEPL